MLFFIFFKDLNTFEELKQQAIPWSYRFKPPNSSITYNVRNTCALDTSLQMIYFLWLRGFFPHDVMEKDPLLSKTMKCIHKGKYVPARHNVLSKMLPNIKRSTDGKEETWICTSDMMDFRPFPTLFKPKRPLVQI
jgi:hypothetical protein